jgi:PAS domain S-box-containing protein
MSPAAATPLDRAFAHLPIVAGISTAALGAVGVAIWLLGTPTMQSFSYGFGTMRMNAALSMILAGSGLALMAERSATSARSAVARYCAILVALMGAATLAEYVMQLDFGIDELLTHAPNFPDGTPSARMAPHTAMSLLLIGMAMLLFDSARRGVRGAAQIASLLVLIIGFFALSGYFLSVDALYGVPGYTSMSLPTAIALTTLSVGLLASRPKRGVVSILAQQNSSGAAIRRLLPVLVVVPLLLAGLHRLGVGGGQFGADFGAALTATLTACLLSALALRNARIQGELENERSRTDEQIQLAMEGAPNGMIIVDAQGKIMLANAEVERLFGYSRTELIGAHVEKLVPLASRAAHERLRADYQSQPVTRAMAPGARALVGSHKNGSVVPLEVSLNPMHTPRGDFVLATIVDARNREKSERAAERERFFQLSNDALCIANTGYFVQVNPAFQKILGFTREELLAEPFLTFIHPDDVEPTKREVQKIRSGEDSMDFRNRYRGKDGRYHWMQWRVIPDHAGLFYATARDITRDLEAASAMQASFKERGVLLQEVHHRVKNNLQIIVSMINMQTRKLRAGVARDALAECGSRVQAIGLIHSTLYQANDFARIPFRDYVVTLVDNIFHASAKDSTTIARDVDIAPVLLTVKKAIPCGLIINELVTNAIKHAFPGDRRGNVRVCLVERDDGLLSLCVADDGVGLGEHFEMESAQSMGMTLMATLVDQLKGRLSITRAPGACFEIIFPREADT